MIETQEFRNGMAMLSGAVNVITTGGSEGLAGFTATAVCSVTDQPPTLLVCMNRSSYAHRFFTANGVLCVNLLGADQQGLSGLFADREVSMEQRFQRAAWRALETGSPALDDALVSFDCRISQIHEVGSHSIFYCEVVQMRQSDPRPGLVYFNRNYHRVGEELRQVG
ncbi:flavin reductase [Zoogloea sp.]|uniref:flavin reductase n=1 Tax=Zoogloea sp. TaxID=49181 RepID=UPI0026157FA7|nr:flavin reductase [uncultured Zoogloea sp.]MCK6376867.1 flavin reductase [Zoogloea sp.]MCK6388889.1 flavin reductase [Zoogloea sp.]